MYYYVVAVSSAKNVIEKTKTQTEPLFFHNVKSDLIIYSEPDTVAYSFMVLQIDPSVHNVIVFLKILIRRSSISLTCWDFGKTERRRYRL